MIQSTAFMFIVPTASHSVGYPHILTEHASDCGVIAAGALGKLHERWVHLVRCDTQTHTRVSTHGHAYTA